MYAPKRLAAALAAAAILATPAVASASTSAAIPGVPSDICLRGVVDLGPFGPLGPYGPRGPYGPDDPLHGQPNPIGNAATCGGFITYILRGGTLEGFIHGNLQSVR